MKRNRFLPSTTKRIELSDGDWIDVKEFVNNGDQHAIDVAGAKDPIFDKGTGRVITPIDWERHDIERALVMITGWSLTGNDGNAKAVSADAMKALDPEFFNEINNAVIKHLLAVIETKKAERESRTKTTETTTLPPSTSPSENSSAPAIETT